MPVLPDGVQSSNLAPTRLARVALHRCGVVSSARNFDTGKSFTVHIVQGYLADFRSGLNGRIVSVSPMTLSSYAQSFDWEGVADHCLQSGSLA